MKNGNFIRLKFTSDHVHFPFKVAFSLFVSGSRYGMIFPSFFPPQGWLGTTQCSVHGSDIQAFLDKIYKLQLTRSAQTYNLPNL
jgi:hypothetical protein